MLRKIFYLVHIFAPGIMIILLANIAFSSNIDDLVGKNLIMNSIVFIFPALYFLQGLSNGLLNQNLLLALGVSTLAFIITTFVWLNSTAISFILIYPIFFFIGYWLARFILKKGIKKV
ncbi:MULTISPECIES: hypothetical protein [Bacillus]|uniref:hypothetical protein n=1 Tax=Bacillus TaxID=1386 RepID=UPI000BB97825|nr:MULTISPECIES: hypothetical protein [Bacillus]